MLLCCGDALIDMIPARTADGRDSYVPAIGGSCCNIAVAPGRLGADAGFMGGISTDFFGALLMSGLAASRVSTRYVGRLERETTLGFVKLGDGEPQYAFYDEATAGRMWRRSDSPELGPEVRLIHIDDAGRLSRHGLTRLAAAEVTAALAYAAAVAAIACTRSGADSPWRHELARRQAEQV